MAKDHSQSEVAVVIVPFIAQGHLNQLLQFSGLISAYGIPIHFVITATHSRQAKLRVHGLDLQTRPNNIHFHEFQIPNFTSPLPDPNTPCKFPSHLQPSFDASLHLHQPVEELLRTLACTARRVVVIHDSLMSSVVRDVVSIPNAEAYMFRPLSVFSFYCNILNNPSETEPELHSLHKSVSSIEGCFSPEFVDYFTYQHSFQTFYSGVLYDSPTLIEGKYLDYLTKEESNGKIKHWGLGPFNPVEVIPIENGSNDRHKSLEWLDQQEQKSVIYVSFGTTTCLSDEQIQELAIGLEESGQKFIWVLRDADIGDVFGVGVGVGVERISLPNGYEKRVEGKGLIVRDWVPQLEILAHQNTGGFMTHCGWNSSMESMTMGVPMATWPMHSDQPRNAVLLTDVLKIGVVVKDWERRDEVVTSFEIKNAVRKLMCSKEGNEIRKRAENLGGDIRSSVAEGGVSRMELDNFIAHITR